MAVLVLYFAMVDGTPMARTPFDSLLSYASGSNSFVSHFTHLIVQLLGIDVLEKARTESGTIGEHDWKAIVGSRCSCTFMLLPCHEVVILVLIADGCQGDILHICVQHHILDQPVGGHESSTQQADSGIEGLQVPRSPKKHQ
eukprot:5124883-Amphidinium_carterae.1